MNTDIEKITIHTETMVKGFFGEYRWLSNYHVCDVEYLGKMYLSSEAAYQSAKTDDEYLKTLFQKMIPKESKSFSKTISVKKDWDKIKKSVMYDVLKSKFSLNQDVRDLLLNTQDKFLEETNYWGDTYWGVCEGKGKNTLGELLMKIRTEIKNEVR